MLGARRCQAQNARGEPCGSPPLLEGELCIVHDPAHADEVAEARRLGGFRRRQEVAVHTTYDLDGIDSVTQLRRLLLIAITDSLALENSLIRNRTLGYLTGVALRLLETGELAERIDALEAAVLPRAVG